MWAGGAVIKMPAWCAFLSECQVVGTGGVMK